MLSDPLRPTPGSRISIVPATWHDFNAVRRLEKICFPQDVWPFWDILGVLTLPSVIRFKAQVDEQLAGFIAVDDRPREGAAWIATIGVLPEFRRRGIATALIQHSESQLQVPYISLSVRASNQAALQLYTRLGYGEVNRWKRYYKGGEDAIVMRKRLQ